MPWQEKKPYQAAWAREKRLRLARAQFLAGDYSRRVMNALGRAAVRADQKWCSWGQHAVRIEEFGFNAERSDQRQDFCLDCYRILARIAHARERKGGQHVATT